MKCQKTSNVLKLLSHTDWGGDKKTLLNLYRSLVGSKLDYGCIIYGSARKSYLKKVRQYSSSGSSVSFRSFPYVTCSKFIFRSQRAVLI